MVGVFTTRVCCLKFIRSISMRLDRKRSAFDGYVQCLLKTVGYIDEIIGSQPALKYESDVIDVLGSNQGFCYVRSSCTNIFIPLTIRQECRNTVVER